MVGVAEINRERTPDDRLNAGTGKLLRKFQRTEHVVGVGQCERRLVVGLRQFGETRDRERAFQQRK
jgi:hypothetical protein